MLHGYTQSGHIFEIKTKALKKSLEKFLPPAPKPGHLQQYPGGVELVYPTGPMKLSTSDIPGYDVDGINNAEKEDPEAYAWWKRKGDSEPYQYDGLESGLTALATTLKEQGPFDGTIGFSQGGAAAAMLATLLETGRKEGFERLEKSGGMQWPTTFTGQDGGPIHPPLKFAVSYAGFGASTHALYRGFYEPKIATPTLHFLGSVDTVVSEERSLRLVEACVDGKGREGGVPRVVYHPGGHHLPSQKQFVAALVAFIKEAVGEDGRVEKAKEERVEDMDLPF
jgi:predicted esterase